MTQYFNCVKRERRKNFLIAVFVDQLFDKYNQMRGSGAKEHFLPQK